MRVNHLIGFPFLKGDVQVVNAGVKEYKYISPPLSWSEKLFLERFWDWFVNVYPMWLAPNLITAIGGLLMFISTALIWGYSPANVGSAPGWVYFTAGLLMFAYQTLDGTDGKQARRTKAGSAMGHLFDHGTDAVVGSMFALWMTDICRFGWGHPLGFAFVPLAQAAFFLSNMVPLHRGRQVFFNLDVMESELATIGALLLTGIFGTEMWQLRLPEFTVTLANYPLALIDTEIHYLPLGAAAFAFITVQAFSSCTNYIYYAFVQPYLLTPRAEWRDREGCGMFACLHQIGTITTYTVLMTFSWIEMYEAAYNPMVGMQVGIPIVHALPLLLLTLFGFAGIASSLLCCYVTKLPFPYLHYGIIAIGFYYTGLDPFGGWISAICCLICYIGFVYQFCTIVTTALGIRLFFITKKVA